ncbi:serine/threonine protein phosphatase 2B catalytic subunit A1, putative [Entamoeba invadens IP1]|uniref:Serine/threonine-protein phosphatase n=1 Tax=Entamoeba invadens IP1 TaxID=370355 RepID=L7FKC9_ENTIV|nr:serine/threonine protein phosphatase 2B catalytic subunit A1, putative [Entamoeba invadens IP1]ELP84857.1 serine/threonine protein phosphatase 2B catalytic subunit A1, putative [Entamoeba invadens IP1]|eukprot:XP_004184203.1 serine/threonine protein phosphatase 2B catalytic subunit A1, putative [Entamoeba invadens IP1]
MTTNVLSTTDRAIKTVDPMIDLLLTYDQFIDTAGNIDFPTLLNHLKQEGRLHPDALLQILKRTQDKLRALPNVITITGRTAVFGDIHGQFYDLCNIYQDFNGSSEKMLFLGDYVDRGCFGTEVIILLFCLKLQFPDRVSLLRGNHECRLMTSYFNFKQECLWKYNTQIYDEIMNTFDCLPLCAVIESDLGNFFCVHGGISPSLQTIKDISYIDRFQEPPEDGLFCDLLWSDPQDDSDYDQLPFNQQLKFQNELFDFNTTRGCSYYYGFSAVRRFLARNDIVCIVRGHEVQKSGCKMNFEGCSETPVTITIFSAPNYCDVYSNDAAVLMITNDELSFLSYTCVAHPFWLPKFANGFYYTLPMITENINKIANRIFNAIVFESFKNEGEEPAEGSTTPELEEKTSSQEQSHHQRSNSKTALMAFRRRTFVGLSTSYSALQNTPPTKKKMTAKEARLGKRTVTLGLKMEFKDGEALFTPTPSERFELAKRNDLANELRPVDTKELRIEWNKLKMEVDQKY